MITLFSTQLREAIPLANLQSTATGVAYIRDEALEGNLNVASGDADTSDRIVQMLDAATGASTSTGMAAADPHSPIYGPSAVTTGGEKVAFLESEASQNARDLNGDGDARDAVLRVFDLTGAEITSGPTLVAAPFTMINRKPVAISGDLVFFRQPQPSDDAVAVFACDASTGALRFVESQTDGVAGVTGLVEPRGILVSPDGGHVMSRPTATIRFRCSRGMSCRER